MNEPTYKDFVEFVKSQREERPINHYDEFGLATWHACVIGDFIRENEIDMRPEDFACTEVLFNNQKVYRVLANPTRYGDSGFLTYGSLAEHL